MSKRVYEIAREQSLDNEEVIQRLQDAGVDVKTHSSSVEDNDYERVFVAGHSVETPNSRSAAQEAEVHEARADAERSGHSAVEEEEPESRGVRVEPGATVKDLGDGEDVEEVAGGKGQQQTAEKERDNAQPREQIQAKSAHATADVSESPPADVPGTEGEVVEGTLSESQGLSQDDSSEAQQLATSSALEAAAAEERPNTEDESPNAPSRESGLDEEARYHLDDLEAQDPLLDQETARRVEAQINGVRSAGSEQESSEAEGRLLSDPAARESIIAAGTDIDQYLNADEALDGKRRAAAEQIKKVEKVEEEANAAGVEVEPQTLRLEYDRLAREAARAMRPQEFDRPRIISALDVLIENARERQSALQNEIAACNAHPEEYSFAKRTLTRAQEELKEYRRTYTEEEYRWGPDALEGAPSPEELSSILSRAAEFLDHAQRAADNGRFVEARSLLREAAVLSRKVMQARRVLEAATAEAEADQAASITRRDTKHVVKVVRDELAEVFGGLDKDQRKIIKEYEDLVESLDGPPAEDFEPKDFPKPFEWELEEPTGEWGAHTTVEKEIEGEGSMRDVISPP